jgi:hypothetical protein
MIFRVAFKGSTWRELDADLFTISRGLLAFAALIVACAGRLYLDFRCWSLLRHARVPMASSGIASWQTRSVVTKCRRAEAARKTRANASIFNLGVLAGECGTMVPIWQRICDGSVKLSVNVITAGRYYRSGEEVPDQEVSDAMRKYVVRDDDGVPKPSPLASSKSPGKVSRSAVLILPGQSKPCSALQ